jgi:hypothetical protein
VEPEELAKKNRGRLRVLETIYDMVDGHTNSTVTIGEDEDGNCENRDHARYLVDKGWLKFSGSGYTVAVTIRGVDRVEEMIAKKKEHGLALLRTLYKATNAGHSDVDLTELNRLGARIGIDSDETEITVEWLEKKSLVTCEGLGDDGRFGLTPNGVAQVEATQGSSRGTDIFGAQVVSTVNNNYTFNAPVAGLVQGNNNTTTATQTITQTQNTQLVQHLADLRSAVEQLDPAVRPDALDQVEMLEEQSKKDKPKLGVVKACSEGLDKLLQPHMIPLLQTIVTLIAASGGVPHV